MAFERGGGQKSLGSLIVPSRLIIFPQKTAHVPESTSAVSASSSASVLRVATLSYSEVGARGPRCDWGVVSRVCNSSGSVMERYRSGRPAKKKYKLYCAVNESS